MEGAWIRRAGGECLVVLEGREVILEGREELSHVMFEGREVLLEGRRKTMEGAWAHAPSPPQQQHRAPAPRARPMLGLAPARRPPTPHKGMPSLPSNIARDLLKLQGIVPPSLTKGAPVSAVAADMSSLPSNIISQGIY